MSTDGAMRVSDADRAQVADRLARAHGEGRLTLVEYDERVRAAHGAVVRSDFQPLLADLPGEDGARPLPPARAAGTADDRRLAGGPVPGLPGLLVSPGLSGSSCSPRGAVASWAVVSALNVLIWLAVVLGTAALVYPWWIWVAGPWGLVLAAKALGRRRVPVG